VFVKGLSKSPKTNLNNLDNPRPMTNTYKVTAEISCFANTEAEARTKIATILTDAAIPGASLLKCECQELETDDSNKKLNKAQRNRESQLEKQAAEQFKDVDFQDENQIPDEIVITNPQGNRQLVANPLKQQQLEQFRKNNKSDEFNPQMNPQDAVIATGGQVNNSESGRGTYDGSEINNINRNNVEVADPKNSTNTNKESSKTSSGASNSSKASTTTKSEDSGAGPSGSNATKKGNEGGSSSSSGSGSKGSTKDESSGKAASENQRPPTTKRS